MDDDSNSYEWRLINVENGVAATTRLALTSKKELTWTTAVLCCVLSCFLIAVACGFVMIDHRIHKLEKAIEQESKHVDYNDGELERMIKNNQHEIDNVKDRLRRFGLLNDTDEPPLALKENK